MDSDDDFAMMESDYEQDDSIMLDDAENAPSRAHATAKAVTSKAPILHTATNDKKKKTVEEIYQKKSQLEHILLRPDTYVGSIEQNEDTMFVVDGEDKIVQKLVTYTPGLFKIFDELIVNAADNKQRDANMDKIEVNINQDDNWISVLNNGKGIPVQIHKEYDMYVPTLIFGQLLTGSNYDDKEKKTTGGRNGYGAKLTNIFSTQFDVECVDTENGKFFKQTFRNNMGTVEKPVIKNLTKAQEKKGDYVKISFQPDLKRFNMTCLDNDIVGLLKRRAYDVAASLSSSDGKKLSVLLNGKKLAIKSFSDYIDHFDGIDKAVATMKVDRWEVAVGCSDGNTQKQISFVNSIFTSKGGTHVDYISKQAIAHLEKTLKKKKQDVAKNLIKNHLCIFINCLIENPAFDSQTKENLITKSSQFGSECTLPPAFLKKLDKSELVESILKYAKFDAQRKLNRKGGKKKTKITGITKLDDANFAGSAKSKDCTLIITEGDSAKSLAMAGLSVVGRDYYGVFPLRGKPLNVREATIKQVTGNEEIKNLIDILGLKFQTQYDETNIKTLRYGHLMIMADQDTDGSHIKGLVINFLHTFWPALLDVPGFLQQFITPIVKATKGKKQKTFFNLPEFKQWVESTGNNAKGWNTKYYKGLGTSTSAEAKDYFSHLNVHEINFSRLCNDKEVAKDNLDLILPDKVKSGSDMIDLAFSKKRVEERKKWLENKVKPEPFLDYSQVSKAEGVTYSDFFNKEYILFSHYDNQRSIPNIMDGFKPSQRKVLFGCLKRKLKGEVKVAQLTGYVAEHSAYHHGEQSLQGTIVGMAANFVGSNNVNLLTPSGQFGTRRMGGKDAASARYIFTKLEPITRAIFHADDDALLIYLEDDGNPIEPEFYVPVIPMILVNGAEGIGTGYSCNIPNYSPREIIANLRHLIMDEATAPMSPHYYGFEGEILKKGPGKYTVNGKIQRVNDETLLITELPVKKWTQDYKVMLEGMMTGDGGKKQPEIDDFKENHTETTVSFTVKAKKEMIDKFESEAGGLYKKFKLTSSLTENNIVVFKEGQLKKIDNPESILRSFFVVRYEYYEKRKDLLVDNLRTEQKKLSNKARFVEEVCSGELVVSNRKRADILAELQSRGYDLFEAKKQTSGDDSDDEDEIEEEHTTAELAKGYEYLLGMKIWSLTFEKAKALRNELEEKTNELDILLSTTPSEIWLNDLSAIEEALDERDAAFAKLAAEEKAAQAKSKKKQTKKTAKKGKKKKDEWDSDMESDDDDVVVLSDSSDDEKVSKKRKPAATKKKAGAAKPLPDNIPEIPSIVKSYREKGEENVIAMQVDEQNPPLAASKLNGKRLSDSSESVPLSKSSSVDTIDDGKDDIIEIEEDEMVLGLAERMQKRFGVPSSQNPSPKSLSDESMSLDVESGAPPKVAAAKKAKKAAPAAKKVAATKKAAASKPKAAATKKASKKKVLYESEEESEDDLSFHSDESEEDLGGLTAAASRSRRTRAPTAKVAAYTFESSSDEDAEADEGSDEDW